MDIKNVISKAAQGIKTRAQKSSSGADSNNADQIKEAGVTASKAVASNPKTLLYGGAIVLVIVLVYSLVAAGSGAVKGIATSLNELPKSCTGIPTDIGDAWNKFTDWLSGKDGCEDCDTKDTITGISAGNAVSDNVDNPRIKRIFKGLLAPPFSFTPEQAAGVVGNIAQESGGGKPRSENSTSGSWGIVQWYRDRRTNAENYIKEKGGGDLLSKTSLSEDEELKLIDLEMGYLWVELQSPSYNAILTGVRRGKDVDEVTKWWENKFEISGESGMTSRYQYARSAYAMYKDEAPEQIVQEEDTTGITGSSSSGGGCSSSGNDLNITASSEEMQAVVDEAIWLADGSRSLYSMDKRNNHEKKGQELDPNRTDRYYDCSSFVFSLYSRNVKSFTANDAWPWSTTSFYQNSREVSLDEMEPGDFLLWGGENNTGGNAHIALFLGREGNMIKIVHASSDRRPPEQQVLVEDIPVDKVEHGTKPRYSKMVN